MGGGRGFVDTPTWFQDRFGFQETSYKETHGRFEFADGVLISKVNGSRFHVGGFDLPSLAELRARVAGGVRVDEGGLTFEHVCGSAKTMILDADNAGAVFQVASQFNCLEMVGPGSRPEDGVTRYYCDATQGPACALACPAATVYRNYFVNGGKGQAGAQINSLEDVEELVGNSKEGYWRMTNGYAMPTGRGSIRKLSDRIKSEAELPDSIRARLRVGVHWDTEVKSGGHRVCQVFSSAVPVSYTKTLASAADWAQFACLVLDATYEATLAVAAILASERQSRVTVYLTSVGGGAFGNRSQWIVQAMEKACEAFASAPLDVKLVHFASVPRGSYAGLEKGRRPVRRPKSPRAAVGAAKTAANAAPSLASEPAAAPVPIAAPLPAPDGLSASACPLREKVTALFAEHDQNGDGVIPRGEFVHVLVALGSELTESDCDAICDAADANGDGEIHYLELLEWLYSADQLVVGKLMGALPS